MGQLNSMGPLASMAGNSLGIKSPGDVYIGLLRSRTVEDAIIKRFDLMTRYRQKTMLDTRKRLEARTLIESGLKDGLISISVTDLDGQRAADIANAYVEELQRLNAKLAITEASQRRQFFEHQLVDAKNNLADAEEALAKTEETTGLVQIDSQTRALIESASALRAQIAAKDVAIQGMRSYATDDNPELATAIQQLAELHNQLNKLEGAQQVNSPGLILSKARTPEAGMEYIRKLRDVKYFEAVFDIMARQFEAAKVDEARQGTMIQVVDLAIKPDKKSFPPRTLILILTAGLAFVVGAAILLLKETFAHVVKSPENRRQLQTFLTLMGSDLAPAKRTP
jgi:uncharacterized protein involved in exopolysaccharide biosynthesis